MGKSLLDVQNFFEGDENEENTKILKKEEIKMTNLFQITTKTVTPLLQIDENGKQRRRYIYENNMTGAVPFFSANGLRGALRRVAFKQQISFAKEKNPEFAVSPELFYLYTSGGGFDKTSAVINDFINFKNEKAVRENAPILSIFGAGLSNLEGKLSLTDLLPGSDMEKFKKIATKDGGEIVLSNLIGDNTFYRADSASTSKFLFNSLIDFEDVKKWTAEYYKKVIIAKVAKKIAGALEPKPDKDGKILPKEKSMAKVEKIIKELNENLDDEVEITIADIEKMQKDGKLKDDSKEEHSHIQQPVSVDFIIPGVALTSSANTKYGVDFTNVELGCLMSSMLELSKMQIGSSKRIGFGILDWMVEFDGSIMFETKSDPNYLLKKNIQVSKKGQELINIWENWARENGEKVKLEDIVQ